MKRIEDEKEKWSEGWMNEYKRMIYCHPNIIFDIRVTGGAKYGGGGGWGEGGGPYGSVGWFLRSLRGFWKN